MYLEESVKRINDRLVCLKGKENIFIWGTSENTVRLFQYTDIVRYSVRGFIDSKMAGGKFFGTIVQHPKDVLWNEIDAVVISSFYREEEIGYELVDRYGYKGLIVRLNAGDQKVPFYEHLSRSDIEVPERDRAILERNSRFKDIHHGERIFVLCTGPSINGMDLLM